MSIFNEKFLIIFIKMGAFLNIHVIIIYKIIIHSFLGKLSKISEKIKKYLSSINIFYLYITVSIL